MTEAMFFDGWSGLLRIFLLGPLAYIVLVAMFRASGKRMIRRMNAFDLVIAVALGTILASLFVNRSLPLADGLVALGLLIVLQFALAWLSARFGRFRQAVQSEPTLLVRDGAYLDAAMKGQRMTREEVEARLRTEGIVSVRDAAFVVLEADGSLSVVARPVSPPQMG